MVGTSNQIEPMLKRGKIADDSPGIEASSKPIIFTSQITQPTYVRNNSCYQTKTTPQQNEMKTKQKASSTVP